MLDDERKLVDLDAVHVIEQGLSFRDYHMSAHPILSGNRRLLQQSLLTLCQLLQLRHGRGYASPDLSRFPRELGAPRPGIPVRRCLF